MISAALVPVKHMIDAGHDPAITRHTGTLGMHWATWHTRDRENHRRAYSAMLPELQEAARHYLPARLGDLQRLCQERGCPLPATVSRALICLAHTDATSGTALEGYSSC